MLWLLFLRADFTDANWDQVMDLSWRVPVLLYVFRRSWFTSPPASWVKLAKENENNLDILIGTMECSQSEQADKYVRNEPLVMRIYEAKIKSVQMVEIKDKLPGLYHRIIDELLMEKHGQLISITNRVPDHFPTIVFDVNREDSIGKRTALKASSAAPFPSVVQFHESYTDESGRRARAHLDKYCVVEFEGNWTTEALSDFVFEYGRELLGEVSWQWWPPNYLDVKRKIVMVVSEDQRYLERIRSLAQEYSRDFCFIVARGKTKSVLLKQTKLSEQSEPIVVVANGDDFVSLSKVTNIHKVRRLLEKVKSNSQSIDWDMYDFEYPLTDQLEESTAIWRSSLWWVVLSAIMSLFCALCCC